MAVMVVLQSILLLSSLVLLPALTVAESALSPDRYAPVSSSAAGTELKIRLYPKQVRLYPGGMAVVSAWTCPAADWSPFGTDRVPGRGRGGE